MEGFRFQISFNFISLAISTHPALEKIVTHFFSSSLWGDRGMWLRTKIPQKLHG